MAVGATRPGEISLLGVSGFNPAPPAGKLEEVLACEKFSASVFYINYKFNNTSRRKGFR